MINARIIHLLSDTHMGLGHHGLSKLARKMIGRDPSELKEGELLMFVNRKRDKLKILGFKGLVVGYLKMPAGQPLMMDAIQFIPKTFNPASGIDYNAAVKRALEIRLARTQKIPVSPLDLKRAKDRATMTARTN
jgi:hypothetical protein